MRLINHSRQPSDELRAIAHAVYRELRKTEGNPKGLKWSKLVITCHDKPRAKYIYWNTRAARIKLSMPLKVQREPLARALYATILDVCYSVSSATNTSAYHAADLGFIERPWDPVAAPKPSKESGKTVRERNHERARERVANAKKKVTQRRAEIDKAIKALARAERFLAGAKKQLKKYDAMVEKIKAAPTKKLTDRDFAKRMAAKRGKE